MRDFPVFTTENGVASLILREIPYRQTAYIKLVDTLEPEKLLEDCREFCCVVGAERIYASGHRILERYPRHTSVLQMEIKSAGLSDTTAKVIPVTEETLGEWKAIYNHRMAEVPNAAYMDDAGVKVMLKDGSGYFVERNGQIIGICKGAGDTIETVASVCPGAGEAVVLALCKELKGNYIRLQVADSNTRAMALYERMGFVKTAEISCWYQIL